ncbi:MAG: hypothetical protein QW597_00380 [Thermoplasmataceae archaeon]
MKVNFSCENFLYTIFGLSGLENHISFQQEVKRISFGKDSQKEKRNSPKRRECKEGT